MVKVLALEFEKGFGHFPLIFVAPVDAYVKAQIKKSPNGENNHLIATLSLGILDFFVPDIHKFVVGLLIELDDPIEITLDFLSIGIARTFKG